MDAITDPRLAGERLLQFAREGRLVQSVWHDEEDGREVACLLGAAAGITDAKECPASLMPACVALVLPAMFDCQSEAHAQTFARRWGEAMVRDEWRRIDWDSVWAEWLAFILQQVQDMAAKARGNGYVVYCAASASAALQSGIAVSAAAWAAAACAAGIPNAFAQAAARDAQADALMDAIEKAMEVARG